MNKSMLPSTEVQCDICKKTINLTKDNLKEEKVTLTKDGESEEVYMTYLSCPHCGKTYPVMMDDAETALLAKDLRNTYLRKIHYFQLCKHTPQKLEERYRKLNSKLNFKRQNLAKKFDGATYQLDGNTIQLDYRYHAR